MKNGRTLEFTSRMSKGESIAVIAYLPVHVLLLPLLLAAMMVRGWINAADVNLICYIAGAVYMFLAAGRFLRREFDSLCDGFLNCVVQIFICYGLMLAMNLCVNGLMMMLTPQENPNNAAIMDMAGMEYGKISAMAVFLAPIVEELIFRAGIFGVLRRRSRALAYCVSILLFAVYHMWSYAFVDPMAWLYLVQYIPVSYLLCRCYEKTNTIWSSIFLHMIINGISIKALMMLEEML